MTAIAQFVEDEEHVAYIQCNATLQVIVEVDVTAQRFPVAVESSTDELSFLRMIIVCKGFNSKEYYVPHYQLVKINWGSLMKRTPPKRRNLRACLSLIFQDYELKL